MYKVGILLSFVRAQRDGLWELYPHAFQRMFPFFFRYYHTNCARWRCVHLAEKHKLPPEVREEFLQGNFVVKGSDQKFNQIDPDHSQEWLNSTGEKGGGNCRN